MEKFELHIDIEAPSQSVIEVLTNNCSLSNSQIKQAIDKGALWLQRGKRTKRHRRLKAELKSGDTLHFYYNETVLAQTTDDAQLIADYIDYSVWYKPSGMLSQGSKWSEHTTITRFVTKAFKSERAVFLVHRLDRAAQGLILIAHNKKAAQAFSQLFEIHSLTKTYHILCHGNATDIGEEKSVNIDIENKRASSIFSFKAYQQESDSSLLEVTIETGRKHQIRLHAESLGYPVIGDRLHGAKAEIDTLNNLQLCAVYLAFKCPLSEEQREINLPEQLRPALVNLKTN